jgi:hypothetical protein
MVVAISIKMWIVCVYFLLVAEPHHHRLGRWTNSFGRLGVLCVVRARPFFVTNWTTDG